MLDVDWEDERAVGHEMELPVYKTVNKGVVPEGEFPEVPKDDGYYNTSYKPTLVANVDKCIRKGGLQHVSTLYSF